MNGNGGASGSDSDVYTAPSSRRRSSKSALEPKDNDVLKRATLWAQLLTPLMLVFFVCAAWFNITGQVDNNSKAIVKMEPVIEQAKVLFPQFKESRIELKQHSELMQLMQKAYMETSFDIRLIKETIKMRDNAKASAP